MAQFYDVSERLEFHDVIDGPKHGNIHLIIQIKRLCQEVDSFSLLKDYIALSILDWLRLSFRD